MEPVTPETLREFLTRLGEHYSNPATLYLLDGSALQLLDNPRQTLDIDYTTDLHPREQQALETIMNNLAVQYRLDIEAVPIAEFVPLPPGAEKRRHFIGRFGQIDVYLYDLYTIALSKIARGFDTDLEDVVFLLRANLIDLNELQGHFQSVLPRAPQADIIPSEFQQYFQDLLHRLNEQ
ncbi:MAG TPA: DUF6036 family nucleotidyltransferase [Anaerovoracaceae bacterium]|nr:DUF6036 family nucleotidyltransferase [Anaerovoracaceae bacterium]